MKRCLLRSVRGNSGFTLVEALLAIAMMGIIMGALASVAAQWLPNWNRSLWRVQRNEQVSIALDRLVADLSAAEFVSANRASKRPLFEGTEFAVTFVRSAIGPNRRQGLEIVRVAEIAERRGPLLVRTSTPFVPLPVFGVASDHLVFGAPVVLLRPPLRIRFEYAARNGPWRRSWQGMSELPFAVRLLAHDMAAKQTLAVQTATYVHVEMPAPASEDVELADPGPVAPRPVESPGGR